MIKNQAVSSYIELFEGKKQQKLIELHEIIASALPDAEEVVSYGMPAFRQKEVIVYYAGHKNHIGFYPTNSGIKAFKEKLTEYKYSKGAIRFSWDKELPSELVQSIVRFRLNEIQHKKRKAGKSG